MGKPGAPPMTKETLTWLREHCGEVVMYHVDPKTGAGFLWWDELEALLAQSGRAAEEVQALLQELLAHPGAHRYRSK
jgi:hypothetical protein